MLSKPAVVAVTAIALTLTAAWRLPMQAGAEDGARSPAGVSHPSAQLDSERATTRFVVDAAGNEARYRVREQLVGLDLPNDAVGVTPRVTGAIVVDDRGNLVPGESRIVVDVTALKSDKDRRDGYVQRRLLETEKFPTVELVPTALTGLPVPLPTGSAAAGPVKLTMTGNLTVKGVTRPTVWQVTARYVDGRVTGNATTAFTFDHFQIQQPRVPVVLSVADTIKLEYDFTLSPKQ